MKLQNGLPCSANPPLISRTHEIPNAKNTPVLLKNPNSSFAFAPAKCTRTPAKLLRPPQRSKDAFRQLAEHEGKKTSSQLVRSFALRPPRRSGLKAPLPALISCPSGGCERTCEKMHRVHFRLPPPKLSVQKIGGSTIAKDAFVRDTVGKRLFTAGDVVARKLFD